ncbi:MAG: hypothetical protein ACERKO_11350 [Acetanaerobacterium sp.]
MNRKSNLRIAFSLMGSIIIASVFCVIIFASLAGALANTAGVALIQAINLIVLFGLVYMSIWTVGEKDINYLKTGHIQSDPLSGLKIGLYAMTVLYLPIVVLIVGVIRHQQLLVAIFRISNAVFFGIHSLFLPVMVEDYRVWHILLTLFIPLIIPAMTSLAYYMGHRRISMLGKLVYKKKKK